MVPIIEMPKHREFQQEPEQQGGRQRQQQCDGKVLRHAIEHHRQVGTQHVLDAVREVDEVHDAEDESQAGGDQEQDHTELQAVENLDDEKGGGHFYSAESRRGFAGWPPSSKHLRARGTIISAPSCTTSAQKSAASKTLAAARTAGSATPDRGSEGRHTSTRSLNNRRPATSSGNPSHMDRGSC